MHRAQSRGAAMRVLLTYLLVLTSGCCGAISFATRRQSRLLSSTLALSTTVSRPRRCFAAVNANSSGLRIWSTEYSHTSVALSPSVLCSPK